MMGAGSSGAFPFSSGKVSRQALGRQRTDWTSTRDPHYVTLLQLCNDLLRRSWTVVSMVVFCAVGGALLSFGRPRTYTSVASFVPEARQPMSAEAEGRDLPIEALTGQGALGGRSRGARLSSVGGTSMRFSALQPAQPLDPSFYSIALRSREVLMAVAGSRLAMATAAGVRSGTAADFFQLPPAPPLSRTEDAARRLLRHVEVVSDDRTSVLTLSVRTTDPVFSQAVAARLLDVLMERNRRMADSRAEAQVAFLTRVVANARQELTIAQHRLAVFLESNRAYVPASQTAMHYRRLDNDVLEKRRAYAELALQLERAKLDRSRATQLLTVVSRPEAPPRPDPRGLVRTTFAGAVGGGALAVLLLLTSAQLRRLRAAGSDELAMLESEWRTVVRRTSGERRATPTTASALSGAERR
jgi:uncharacterized protein involved in exopolysaccharide biosynthesis